MKGVVNMDENNLDIRILRNEGHIIVNLTDMEFDYIKELCNSMYNNLKNFPKKFRTPKFYILENMINDIFKK